MQPSPYTPGTVAHLLPGRERQLAQMERILVTKVVEGRFEGRIRVDIGARGVGKTSLLREVERRARSYGVVTVWVTAGEGSLVDALVAGLTAVIREHMPSTAAERLAAALDSVTVSLGVPQAASVEAVLASGDDTAPPTRALQALIQEAARMPNTRGLAVFVDELQSAPTADLRSLAYAWQHLQSVPDVPAALFAAGLSHTPEVVTAGASFGERFNFRRLGTLDEDESLEALIAPTQPLGVHWEPSAVARIVALSEGYPFFLQTYGEAVWEAAGHPDPGRVLTPEDVRIAEDLATETLDTFYRTRWARASEGEQAMLVAMAQLGGVEVRRGDIADRLGVSTQSLSVPRERLMDKGLIGPVGHGRLSFTAPRFAQFLRRAELDG